MAIIQPPGPNNAAFLITKNRANALANASLTFAILGDSRTANSHGGAGSLARGYAYWAETLSRGRIRIPAAYNYGVSGDTTAQILVRSATAAATAADGLIILGGVNDALGVNSIANIKTMVNDALSKGKLVFVFPELSRDSTWGSDRIAQHMAVHVGVKALAGTPGIFVPDVWPIYMDPITGLALSGMSTDGVHQSVLGAYTMGKALSDIVTPRMSAPSLLPSCNQDIYNATYNPRGCLIPNPMMTGTAGTLTSGVTGQLPDSWSAARAGTNTTAVGSKVTSGGKDWLQVVLGGTPPEAFAITKIRGDVPVGNVSVGDVLEGVLEFEVDAGSANVIGPFIQIAPAGSTTAVAAAGILANAEVTSFGGAPNVAHSGVTRTPPFTVPAGLTTLRLEICWVHAQSLATSMTCRVRAGAIRKV